MKKILAYALLTIGTVGLVGAGVVSAHGLFGNGAGEQSVNREARHENRIENKAGVLGLSADELKAKLADGKIFCEIAEEQGVDKEQFREQMKEQRTQRAQEKLSQMVASGKITQEQADEWLKNGKGFGLKNGGAGWRSGR